MDLAVRCFADCAGCSILKILGGGKSAETRICKPSYPPDYY